MSNQLIFSETAKVVSKVKKAFEAALNKNKKLKEQFEILDIEVPIWSAYVFENTKEVIAEYKEIKEKELELLIGALDSRLLKFTLRRRDDLEQIIYYNATNLFQQFQSEKAKEILQRLDPQFEEDEKQDEAEAISSYFENIFGIKLDPDDILGKSFEEVLEDSKEKIDDAYDAQETHKAQFKSKKQQQNKARNKKEEELLDMDITRLYKELVMKLHPDKEMDEALKLEKEELMKIANGAREQNDIFELLQLRLRVFEKSDDDAIFGDDTMKRLTKLLREKNNQLLGKIEMLYGTSRLFNLIDDYKKFIKKPEAIKQICTEHIQQLKLTYVQLNQLLDSLKNNSDFNHFIDAMIDEVKNRMMLEEMMGNHFEFDDDMFDF